MYPGSESNNPTVIAGSKSFQLSPPKYPSPWGEGKGDWAGAYAQAKAFVSQLTLEEKVNLTTGTGWELDRCVGQTGSIPRLGFRAMCLQDSPVGVRDTDFNSVFPAGVNVAASWDRGVAYARGRAMGQEHKGKGVDVQLGIAQFESPAGDNLLTFALQVPLQARSVERLRAVGTGKASVLTQSSPVLCLPRASKAFRALVF